MDDLVERFRRQVEVALKYAADEKPAHEPVAKRWLVEQTLPSGSIKWECVEHEHHAREIAIHAAAPVVVTPLYTTPPAQPPSEEDDLIATTIERCARIAQGESQYGVLQAPVAQIRTEIAEQILAFRNARQRCEPVAKATHRHVKTGGEYTLLGIGRMQAKQHWVELGMQGDGDPLDMREVAIYRGADSKLWVRPREEFEDGRFVALTSSEPVAVKEGGE